MGGAILDWTKLLYIWFSVQYVMGDDALMKWLIGGTFKLTTSIVLPIFDDNLIPA